MNLASTLSGHLPILALGSTVILVAGVAAMGMSRSVIGRRRLGTTTLLVLLGWIGLSAVPMRRPLVAEGDASRVVPARDAVAVVASETAPLLSDALLGSVSSRGTGQSRSESRSASDSSKGASSNLASPQPGSPSLCPTWLSVVFAVGSLLSVGYILTAWCVLRYRIRRSSLAPSEVQSLVNELATDVRPTRALVLPGVTRPFCFGLRRATVVLPTELCAPDRSEQLRAVLLHELAHIRGHDLRDQALLALALPFVYWHPLFWRLRSQLRLDAELLADDHAARTVNRTTYVRGLIELVERTPAQPLAPMLSIAGRQSDFYRRMNMLLERKDALSTRCSNIHTVLRRTCAIALLAATTLSLGATGAQAQEQPTRRGKSSSKLAAKTAETSPVKLKIDATYDTSEQLEKFMVAAAEIAGGFHDVQFRAARNKAQSKRLTATLHLPSSSQARTISKLEEISAASGVCLIRVLRSKPTPAPSRRKKAAADRAKMQKVSVSFSDAPVQDVIDSIAQMAGANIVLAPEVQGSLSLRLKDVPWRSALEVAALSLGYVVVDVGDGILMVTTRPAADLVRSDKRAGN